MTYVSYFFSAGSFTPRYSNLIFLMLGEETNGSTAYVESSGHLPACDGSLNDGAAVSTAQAKFGTGSIFFDGTNDWIETNVNASSDDWDMQSKWCVEGYFYSGSAPVAGTGSTSLMPFYVRRNSDTDRTFIAYSYWTGGGLQSTPGIWLQIDNGGNSLTLIADVTFSTSSWQKWAVEYDGNEYMIRVDDVEINAVASTIKHSSTALNNFHIAYGWSSVFFLHGYLDTYAISIDPLDEAPFVDAQGSFYLRTQAPFRHLTMNLDTTRGIPKQLTIASGIFADLVAWWDFEENDATTAWIDSHSTHDFTLLASRTTSQDSAGTGIASKVDRSVLILPTSDTGGYVPRADSAFDKGDTGFSFGGWVRFSTVGTNDFNHYIMGRWGSLTEGSGYQSYQIGFYSKWFPANISKFTYVARNAGDTTTTSVQHSTIISHSTYYFVVYVHDAINNTISLYVDGVKESTAFSGGPYATGTANFSFGNGFRSDTTYYDTTRDIQHNLDSVFFVNRAITDEEEAYLRNGGSGMNYAQLVADA